MSVFDRLASDDLTLSRRAADDDRSRLRRLQESCHIVLRVDLEGYGRRCCGLRCHTSKHIESAVLLGTDRPKFTDEEAAKPLVALVEHKA